MVNKQITPFQLTDQFTMDNFNQRINEINIALQSKPNPNLLINSYFADPHNQRGKTSYTGEVPTIDCWNAKWSGDGVISLANAGNYNGTIILYRGSGDRAYLNQVLDCKTLRKRQITASALGRPDSGGEARLRLRFYDDSGNFLSETDDASTVSTSLNMLTVTAVVPGNASQIYFMLISSNKIRSLYRAAKLELGNRQTLGHADATADGGWVLHDPPPDKALELAKCRRYIIKDQITVCTDSNGYCTVMFPQTMRAVPGVTASEGTAESVTKSGFVLHASASSVITLTYTATAEL